VVLPGAAAGCATVAPLERASFPGPARRAAVPTWGSHPLRGSVGAPHSPVASRRHAAGTRPWLTAGC